MVTSTKSLAKQHIDLKPKLEVNRTVQWLGTVTYDSVYGATEDIKKLLADDPEAYINLVVTSPGGVSGTAMSFYDTMKHLYKPKLRTIGSGDVDSSGVIIFLTGEDRWLTPHTTLLLHLAGRTFEASKRFSTADMETMLKEDKLKDYYYACIVAEHTGNKLLPQQVLEMMAVETILTAHEAVDLGLAHGILG